MPNRSMPAAPQPTPGALLMGDAFNMRHPLTGGGMTVALSDIVVLRNLLKPLKDLNDAPTLCKYLESFYTLRKVLTLVFVVAILWAFVSKSCNIFVSNCSLWLLQSTHWQGHCTRCFVHRQIKPGRRWDKLALIIWALEEYSQMGLSPCFRDWILAHWVSFSISLRLQYTELVAYCFHFLL